MQKGKIKYGDNIVGQKFGMLTVLEFAGIYGTGTHAKRMFKCLCDCGIIKNFRVASLISGKVSCCGCKSKPYRNEILAKYGIYHLDLLYRHGQIIRRCYSPKEKAYSNYGARGITVCDLWKNNFLSFYDWCMENGWAKGLQIDNNNGYSPENCRFVTATQNMRNTRKNKLITHNGTTHCVTEWAEITGIHEATIRHRVYNGWPPEKWFIPLTKRKPSEMPAKIIKPIIVQFDLSGNKIAEHHNISAASRASGVPTSNISMFFSGIIKQTKGFTWSKMLPQTG